MNQSTYETIKSTKLQSKVVQKSLLTRCNSTQLMALCFMWAKPIKLDRSCVGTVTDHQMIQSTRLGAFTNISLLTIGKE